MFSDGKKYGFMNDDGSVFVKAMFEDAKPFKSNVAAVKKGGKWGFIDIYGNTVIEPVYSEVTNVMSNGMILVLDEDGYWKLINIPLVSGKK